MHSLTKGVASLDLQSVQQPVKWLVYSLLAVNFGFYIYEDIDRAIHTLHADSTLFHWTSQFATSIDTLAWFVLLFMLELETYVFEDWDRKPWLLKTVHGIRIACYLMIAHTVAAFVDAVIDYAPTIPVENASTLCDLADGDVSFVYNLAYTEITAETCTQLTNETAFYWLGDNPLVSTYAGLELERDLAWSDLIEAIVWLAIIFAIEVVVRLRQRGITSGRLQLTAQSARLLGYGVLFVLSVYWAALGHWLYTWDTFIWVAGFAAIEMNVSEWRKEILFENSGLAAGGAGRIR
jgi:hypothetical protein